MDDRNYRIEALAQNLGVKLEALKESIYDDKTIQHGDNEYLVVTDDEADKLWEESLENYIDDCLEIPEAIEIYFDREKWKEDARVDGRAHSLNHYDGGEEMETIEGEDYYIYRTN